MGYVVLVDSSSDILPQWSSKAGISVVPMPVTIDGQTLLEGIDILPKEFYTKFGSFKELPKTSQPNPTLLKEKYEEILATGNEVVAIHLSSGLSSTYLTAEMVRSTCSKPDEVHIIDSRGASFGYGLLALQASEIVKECTSWEEAEKQILNIRDHMRYIFTLDTLEYLVKGGRINKAAGFVGGLLDVKPILHITREGRIEPFAKVRSRKSALRKLIDIMLSEIDQSKEQTIGISHANCKEEAEWLALEIKSKLLVKDILISEIGCVIGSHTGPRTLALFYQRK